MANQDAAFGFRPVKHLSGGEIRNNTYRITTNYDTALYQGQMVTRVTAGTIETVAANAIFLGIFNGCQYTDPTTGKPTWAKYYPASTNASDIEAYIFDDPSNSDTSTANVNAYVVPSQDLHFFLQAATLA